MRISAQAKMQIMRLIDEGKSLDPFDLVASYRWTCAAYEALQCDPVQQERFAEYPCVSPLKRLYVGLEILEQVLYGDTPEDYTPAYSQV